MLHFNCGHPPNAELERIVRLSGGSELARIAVKGIRCAVCSKAKPPEIAKPGRIKTNIGQFNDALLGDICYETDSNGTTHGWLLLVDEGTGWTVANYLSGGKTWQELCTHIEEGWIDWAGPPSIFVADSERGFIAEGLPFG